MINSIHLEYVNEAFVRVIAETGICRELAQAFTWKAPNWKYDIRVKRFGWNGDVCLFNQRTRLIYSGLAKQIKQFCKERKYAFSFDEELLYDGFSKKQLEKHIDSLKLPKKFEIRDYQFDSVLHCIQRNRCTLLSPTSSGKSMMIYLLSSYYAAQQYHKTLIIVPTINLVKQMESDFKEYGSKDIIHTSLDGLDQSNNIEADVVITTWQSIYNMPEEWFQQFGCVFGDEAHGAKAKSMIKIMTNLSGCKYRFGTTGTLDDNLLHKHTIQGLFGPIYTATTTKEMISRGFASKLQVKCIVLHYPESVCKAFRKTNPDYQAEVDFLVGNKSRNDFITKLTLSLKNNRLLFFKLRSHGQTLFNALTAVTGDVFYIDGTVNAIDRDAIRKAIEEEKNAILVASLGTTSTGVNINRLHHMIAASPSKSKIRVLQSIGRMLRLHEEKNESGAILYDIIDDLTFGTKRNITLQHFDSRQDIYNAEHFNYKIYHINLKES